MGGGTDTSAPGPELIGGAAEGAGVFNSEAPPSPPPCRGPESGAGGGPGAGAPSSWPAFRAQRLVGRVGAGLAALEGSLRLSGPPWAAAAARPWGPAASRTWKASAAQVTAVLEHVAGVRMQRPIGALAWLVRGAGHFDKAVVEGERVADGVLPALLVLPVIGKRSMIH